MSIQDLLNNEDQFVTRMGLGFLGQRVVYRGRDLHHDLGNHSWLAVYLFGITGRDFSERELAMLNFVWVATSYPDPRIWPNQVAALAGSVRTTATLALTAGMAISEASLYGKRPDVRGIDFMLRARAAVAGGVELKVFIADERRTNKVIFGYGRPITRTDERVPHTLKKMQQLNFLDGAHVQLALAVGAIMKKQKGLEMNIGALYSSLAADLGFTAQDYHLFMTPAFVAGMVPCYIESKEKTIGGFLPLRCERINYTGKNSRSWS